MDRYPTLRSVVLRWDEFLDGNGKFLMVMWDAPVALWDFFLPPRDDDHERPEVTCATTTFMLRVWVVVCKVWVLRCAHGMCVVRCCCDIGWAALIV